MKHLASQDIKAKLARQRQKLMILQAASKVCQLNRRARPGNTSVLFRVQLLLARIHKHAIAVGKALAGERLIGLTAIVEGDRIGPNVLDAVTLLLTIVLPVITVPVEIDLDAVLEAAPDSSSRIRRRGIDDNGAAERTTAVIDPVVMTTCSFLKRALDLKSLRT